MTTLLEASPVPTSLFRRPFAVPAAPADVPAPAVTPVTALSRVRGGTFSPTVDVIRFADGTTAHTDLIRLNPNIDAYSLDFHGVSPRHLSHYREVGWWAARRPSAIRWQTEITRILAAGYPFRSTAELTRRLTAAGYDLGAAEIRPHEAIAATQAAIWRFTNGLELDTRPLDAPVQLRPVGGQEATVSRSAVGADWAVDLLAGTPAHLEVELAGAPQVTAFSFAVEAAFGHGVRVHLERSSDGRTWRRVSHSSAPLDEAGQVHRPLGHGATLSSVDASGPRGHRFYRLTAIATTDVRLDLRGVRLHLTGGARFINNERVVALYELLSKQAVAEEAIDLVHAHVLIGATTPDGPSVFTPLVSLAPAPLTPGAASRPHLS